MIELVLLFEFELLIIPSLFELLELLFLFAELPERSFELPLFTVPLLESLDDRFRFTELLLLSEPLRFTVPLLLSLVDLVRLTELFRSFVRVERTPALFPERSADLLLTVEPVLLVRLTCLSLTVVRILLLELT